MKRGAIWKAAAVLALTLGVAMGISKMLEESPFGRLIGSRPTLNVPSPQNPYYSDWVRHAYTWPESASAVEARATQSFTPADGWERNGALTEGDGRIVFSRTQEPHIPRLVFARGRLVLLSRTPIRDTVEIRPALAYSRTGIKPPKDRAATPWTTVLIERGEPMTGWGCGRLDWGLDMMPTPY